MEITLQVCSFPLAAGLFQQAMDAGYGCEEVSDLFKVLQKPA
jgi:hypothetical protein